MGKIYTPVHKKAFTLIEVMIVVVIVGVLATTVLPRLMRQSPSSQWPNLLGEMNNMLFFARQEAIAYQKNYRLAFYSHKDKPDSLVVEVSGPDPEKPGKTLYKKVVSEFFETEFLFPKEVRIKSVLLGKVDQLVEQKNKGYCYVIPNGLVQEISVVLERVIDENEEQARFSIAPFFGRFNLIEEPEGR